MNLSEQCKVKPQYKQRFNIHCNRRPATLNVVIMKNLQLKMMELTVFIQHIHLSLSFFSHSNDERANAAGWGESVIFRAL